MELYVDGLAARGASHLAMADGGRIWGGKNLIIRILPATSNEWDSQGNPKPGRIQVKHGSLSQMSGAVGMFA